MIDEINYIGPAMLRSGAVVAVYQCLDCDFRIGLDNRYLEVESIIMDCPACNRTFNTKNDCVPDDIAAMLGTNH